MAPRKGRKTAHARRNLWAARVQAGRRLAVSVPEDTELCIAHACADSDTPALIKAYEPSAQVGMQARAEATGRLGLSLPPADWQLEASMGAEPPSDVDLVGYFTHRSNKRRHVMSRPVDLAELRRVPLPAGWAGLSFRAAEDGRLIITEVPKTCFSSTSFGASAPGQVSGVMPGDEIVLINGLTPAVLAERICTAGDPLNACGAAGSPHVPGTRGKLDTPPCISCDFMRRRSGLGLHVAYQMWMRAVKREESIVLSVGPGSGELPTTDTCLSQVANSNMTQPTQVNPLASAPELSSLSRNARLQHCASVSCPPQSTLQKQESEICLKSLLAAVPDVSSVSPLLDANKNDILESVMEDASALVPALAKSKPAAKDQTSSCRRPSNESAGEKLNAAAYNPLKPAAAYNPLRPLALSASAQIQKSKTKAALAAPRRVITPVVGFPYEEVAPGKGGLDPALQGQEVELRFAIRVPDSLSGKSKDDVVERGEVRCRLGESEVLDGWVDGGVDMEEVLASWGRCAVGMRQGEKRRLHIPAKASFRQCGGDLDGKALLCDVELLRLF